MRFDVQMACSLALYASGGSGKAMGLDDVSHFVI
jgi:hypothetical protein